jgi:hypothetical protein
MLQTVKTGIAERWRKIHAKATFYAKTINAYSKPRIINFLIWLDDTATPLKKILGSLIGREDLFVSEDKYIPLDQVTRFYQSDFYCALDEKLRDAFTDLPLAGNDSRLIQRSTMQQLRNAVQAWQEGRNLSMVINAEKSSGLTTLLNSFALHLKENKISHQYTTLNERLTSPLDITTLVKELFHLRSDPIGLDNLIVHINSLKPKVIILDNLHFLVQRTAAAQSVIDTLGAIILGTRGHHLWVLGCEEQAWRRLNYGYEFAHVFSHTVTLQNFSRSEIHELLITRFHSAGFTHINEVPLAELKKTKTPIDAISRKSKGCIELALFYCLANMQYGTSQYKVFLQRPLGINISALKDLDNSELFTLAEICTHGQLSPSEHRIIFRNTLNQSKMALEHLRVLGLLDQVAPGNRREAYELKLIASSMIINHLIAANYLY